MFYYTIQIIGVKNKVLKSTFSLGIFLTTILLFLIINALQALGYFYEFSFKGILSESILLAIIPTYFYYCNSLNKTSQKIFNLPLIIYYLPSILILIIKFADAISPLNSNLTSLLFTSFALILPLISLVFYVNKTKENKIANSPLNILWNHIIFASLIVIYTSFTALYLLDIPFNHTLTVVSNIIILLSGGILGHFALKQNKLIITNFEKGNIDIKTSTNSNGNTTGNVSPEETRIIVTALKDHLEIDKPYLDINLTAKDIANKLAIPKYKLTYILNKEFKTNFYGIINEYRIKEAVKLLENSENHKYKIEIIANMVGFNSKSSFNVSFKNIVGETPSNYRKRFTKQ